MSTLKQFEGKTIKRIEVSTNGPGYVSCYLIFYFTDGTSVQLLHNSQGIELNVPKAS